MIINKDTVRMLDELKQKIFEFQVPETKKELQRFLSTINYNRRFVDNLNEKNINSLLYAEKV